MRITLICAICSLLGVATVVGQEPSKPTISSITVLPSEPIIPSGDCKSSTAGYLEKSRQRAMFDDELGTFVSKSLRDGYILTVYPATKTGIFVNMQCTNTMPSARP
jgi:hypothetical protein